MPTSVEGARLGRYLTLRYSVALAIISLTLVISVVYDKMNNAERTYLRRLITVSDNQGDLYDKVKALATQLVNSPSPEKRRMLAASIEETADTLARNNGALTKGQFDDTHASMLTPQLASIYFDSPTHLDALIKSYVAHTKKLVAGAATATVENSDYQFLIDPESEHFLELLANAQDLELALMQHIVKENDFFESAIHAAGFLILMLEALFIFRPMVKKVVLAQTRLEQYSQLKNEFLASVSHEIRTPMNGIFGMAELLQETHLDNRQQEFLSTLLNTADGLLAMIDDILDLSTLDAGRVSIDPLMFDLYKTIEDVAQLMATNIHNPHIEMIVRYQPGLPRQVIGDPGRVRQVLCNLVGNALKFTQSGYVMLSVERDLEPDAPFMIFVEDTGVGIPPDRIASIFEPFLHVDGSMSRKTGGLGIGLPIVDRLVKLMGGRVKVRSKLGEGSRFTVTLPLKTVETGYSLLPETRQALKQLKLLVVDDLAVNRELLGEQVAPHVQSCHIAGNAEEALRLLREEAAAGKPFDMALVDYFMPDMDGEALTCAIKNEPAIAETIVIVLTSAGEAGHASRFTAAGADAFLAKPVRPALLIDTMSLSLESRNRPGEPIITIHTTEALAASRLAGKPSPLKNARILLVEDNRVNLRFTCELLEQMGCKVSLAENGERALDSVKTAAFDLILMDCQMPGMDGFAATRAIRHRESQLHGMPVPIVALTANAMSGDRERCLIAGMSDYLSKPVRRANMEAMLSRWLSGTQDDPFVETASRIELPLAIVEPGTALIPQPAIEQSPYPADAAGMLFPKEGEVTAEAAAAVSTPIDQTLLDETRDLMSDQFSLLLSYYLEDGENYLREIHRGVAEGDVSIAAAAAHTLKSSSRQFGILKVGELAADIEKSCRNAINQGATLPQEVTRLIGEATEAFKEAATLLKPYLAA